MLVYANNLSFRGAGAKDAVLKGVGAWLKEQLGFGLHPDQLQTDGEFDGFRGESRSWLRIRTTLEEDPQLYSWVLRNQDDAVHGRQWTTEIGLKFARGVLDLSCVVKTDETSTLVSSPIIASQPRVVRYVVNNVLRADHADFTGFVPGVRAFTSGQDRDSFRGLQAHIERPDRDGAVVIISPTKTGEYLLSARELQHRLIGLAQVVEMVPETNSYTMVEEIGESRAAWGGAVNILFAANAAGVVRGRRFLAAEIASWGETQGERIARILAWVTSNTNTRHLRRHVRPEGVVQLALRRRLQASRVASASMNETELRAQLDAAHDQLAKQSAEQSNYLDQLANENGVLESTIERLRADADDQADRLAKQDYTIRALKERLNQAGGDRSQSDPLVLLELVCQDTEPSPRQCLMVLENQFGDRCVVLDSAWSSAERMERFVYGRTLMDMLRRLVTTYRDALLAGGGDSEARKIFGRNEYAAKESETVMASKTLARQRTFLYQGAPVEMFRHLKIGVDDDVTRTIRVHFHWDADRSVIVVGYCGEHLPVASH